MSGPHLINLVHLIGALLVLGLGIPLLLEKIGPNGLYGFRTARTRSDPKVWYAVNKVLGRNLLLASSLMLAMTIVIFVACKDLQVLEVALINLGVAVVALGLAIGHSVMALRRM